VCKVVAFAAIACASLAQSGFVSISAAQSPAPADPACALNIDWEMVIPQYGLKAFESAKVVEPTSREKTYELSAEFVTTTIAGCKTSLRSYNSPANAPRPFLVGDTIKARPGDTLYIRLTNNLPDRGKHDDFPQHPPPPDHAGHFSFNLTNLHTHGLHVAPNGPPGKPESDNVFVEIAPGTSQDYEIKIPPNHSSGTFWYHAHLHGATAVQVSSGMAGALIIEGGDAANGELTTVPTIAAAKDRTFVLQQLVFGPDGKLDDFKSGFIDNDNWDRHTTINGQLVPTLTMRPGELQRWRFVHAGFLEKIDLVLDGHKLNEVAADGISLGRLVSWDQMELGPGYRTDVLIKAGAPGTYFLRSSPLPKVASLRSQRAALKISASRGLNETPVDVIAQLPQLFADTPGNRIARLVVEGDPMDMKLPTDDELKAVAPRLDPISEDPIKTPVEELLFIAERRICSSGHCPPPRCPIGATGCEQRFLAGPKGDWVFMPDAGRTFQLNQTSKWTVQGKGQTHIFHIHVNPFQVDRPEPGGTTRRIWRDTQIITSGAPPLELRTRYSDFTGSFVMHCHVLSHEDQGMMEKITIKP